jgi:hypothetical protein
MTEKENIKKGGVATIDTSDTTQEPTYVDLTDTEQQKETWENRTPPTFEQLKAMQKALEDKGIFDTPKRLTYEQQTQIENLMKSMTETNKRLEQENKAIMKSLLSVEKECHGLLTTLANTTQKYNNLIMQKQETRYYVEGMNTEPQDKPVATQQQIAVTPTPTKRKETVKPFVKWFAQRSTIGKYLIVLNPITTIVIGVIIGKSDITVSMVAFCWIVWFVAFVFHGGSKLCQWLK